MRKAPRRVFGKRRAEFLGSGGQSFGKPAARAWKPAARAWKPAAEAQLKRKQSTASSMTQNSPSGSDGRCAENMRLAR